MGSSSVLITHKVNILSIVDKIIILADGKVQAYGDRDEVFRRFAAPKVVRTEVERLPSQGPDFGGGLVSAQ